MNIMNLFVTKALAERQGNIDSDAVNKAALIAGFVPSFAGLVVGKTLIDRAVEEADLKAVEIKADLIAAEREAKAAAEEKAAEAAQDQGLKNIGVQSTEALSVALDATKIADQAIKVAAQFETMIAELKADNVRIQQALDALHKELKSRDGLSSGEKTPNAKKA
jgi:hypothetical protein